MKGTKQLDQFLDRGRATAERTLGAEEAARLPSLARARLGPREGAAPRVRDRVNQGLFATVIPLLALYQALRGDLELAEGVALHLTEAMLRASFMVNFSPLKRAAFSLGLDFVPLRNLLLRRSMRLDEPGGFQFEAADLGSAEFGFDVRRCPITEYARAQGAPEIVPVICRLDDAMAAHLKHLRLERSGTLGGGAERCDFRYYRKG
ncbi:MAG: L-2-amino-thiazoline-4-carboxylic acid hydrolase [Nannocystaceae bacterium]